MNRIIAIAALLALSFPSLSIAEEPAPQPAVETSPEKGMRLTDAALKTLEVKTEAAGAQRASYQLPASALVYSQDRIGVYRLREGWFKLIKVTLLGRPGTKASVRTAELKAGDRIVTRGAALLRVAQMDAEGGAE
ncbi:MAG: hypothetical protein HY923_06625 [Elusimicrobia bacterium]|nr:hypothetical protein [Elusimicrobiota bacterium]